MGVRAGPGWEVFALALPFLPSPSQQTLRLASGLEGLAPSPPSSALPLSFLPFSGLIVRNKGAPQPCLLSHGAVVGTGGRDASGPLEGRAVLLPA